MIPAEKFPNLGDEVHVNKNLYAICKLIIAASTQIPTNYNATQLAEIDIGQWACLGNKIHDGNFVNTNITGCSVCPIGMLNR